MGGELAISLKNVSKCYKRYSRPVERLKEIVLPGKSRAEEFWALRDINFDIFRGETLGIIGQNGSGKSTLLQIIAGTLTSTTGEVHVNGRVSALLELGCGFNPEFTGRQNVFFNGQILGLSVKEIEAKFDDIAAFAEIGDFIDQPVKTYSSGMVVRLAFAVVANTEPKILIVDEALAVGDAKFQARCMKRIRQLKEQGVTILFVSHDSSSIKMLCQRAALMNYGRLLEIGQPKEVVNHYIAILSSENPSEIDDISKIALVPENHLNNYEEVSTIQTNEVQNTTEIDSIYPEDHLNNGITDIPEESTEMSEPPALCENYLNNEEAITNIEENLVRFVHRHGNQLAVIHNVILTSLDNKEVSKVETGDTIKIKVLLEAKGCLSDLVVGISLRNLMGLVIYGTNTRLTDVKVPHLNQDERIVVVFQVPCYLNKGVYTVTVAGHSEEGVSYDWIDDVVVFEVNNSNSCDGFVDLSSTVELNKLYINSKVKILS